MPIAARFDDKPNKWCLRYRGWWLSSGVKSASVLVFGVMGGGVLDDMVLMCSYIACCVVHFDLLLGGHRILS